MVRDITGLGKTISLTCQRLAGDVLKAALSKDEAELKTI